MLLSSGNFQAQLVQRENQEPIPLKEHAIKPGGNNSLEYFQFEVPRPGWFQLNLQNQRSIKMKPTILLVSRFFQRAVPVEELTIRVKQSISLSKRLFGILLMILGANFCGWGFILAFNPGLLG